MASGHCVITLVWHDFNNWQQIRALGNVPHREILVYVAAAIELFGGIAIQWPRTVRAGAFAPGSIYLSLCVALGAALFRAVFSGLGRTDRIRVG
jgi:uncharacterized membrane protein